jgi:hypothetical protein
MTATLSQRERAWYSQQWVRDTLVAEVAEGLRKHGEGSLEDSLISVRPFDIEVASIQCPVLAVHGSADDWEPLPNLRRVLTLVPDAQLIVLEGLHHFGAAHVSGSPALPRQPRTSHELAGRQVRDSGNTPRSWRSRESVPCRSSLRRVPGDR